MIILKDVALTGRNRTGPPCSVGRPTANAPGPRRLTAHVPDGRPARTPKTLQTTTTDDRRLRAWSYLPSFVRDEQSLAAFRRQLKTLLFRTSFDANT